MSFSDIPTAAIAAWASLVTAIFTPCMAVFMFLMGRKVEKIGEQTNGMSQALSKAAGKAGHAAGVAQATAAGEEKAAALAEGQAQGRADQSDMREYYGKRHDALRSAHEDE